MAFVKGVSGNPAGRPRSGQALTELLRTALSHKGPDGVTLRRALTEQLAAKAAAGDLDAIKIVLDRIDGKVPEFRTVEGAVNIVLSWDDGRSD